MSVYLVSYDLNRPKQDYQKLYDRLKSHAAWWHYLDSTWLVSTSKSASELFERIQPAIDDNDSVLVIDVGRDYAGWLPKKAWDWIKNHLEVATHV